MPGLVRLLKGATERAIKRIRKHAAQEGWRIDEDHIRIILGDLSPQTGKCPGHLSHTKGRHVDIGYFYREQRKEEQYVLNLFISASTLLGPYCSLMDLAGGSGLKVNESDTWPYRYVRAWRVNEKRASYAQWLGIDGAKKEYEVRNKKGVKKRMLIPSVTRRNAEAKYRYLVQSEDKLQDRSKSRLEKEIDLAAPLRVPWRPDEKAPIRWVAWDVELNRILIEELLADKEAEAVKLFMDPIYMLLLHAALRDAGNSAMFERARAVLDNDGNHDNHVHLKIR